MELSEKLHKQSMDKNIDKKEIYNEWADTYDEYVKSLHYSGPKELVSRVFSNIENIPNDFSVLDFGCGTGLVGEEIKLLNINCVLDGIDISDKMIELAQKKNIYNKIYNINLHSEEFIYNKKYDIIVSSGVFLEGHANFNVIDKLSPLLKKDGMIVVTIRDSYKDHNKETFYTYFENNKLFRKPSISKINYLPGIQCSLIILHNI